MSTTNPYAPIYVPVIGSVTISPSTVKTGQTFSISVTVTETTITPQAVSVKSGQIKSGQFPFT